jgi:hypothetical protein
MEDMWVDSMQGWWVTISTNYRERFGDLHSLLANGPQYQGSRSVIPNNHINIMLTIRILQYFPYLIMAESIINIWKMVYFLYYHREGWIALFLVPAILWRVVQQEQLDLTCGLSIMLQVYLEWNNFSVMTVKLVTRQWNKVFTCVYACPCRWVRVCYFIEQILIFSNIGITTTACTWDLTTNWTPHVCVSH